MSSIIPPDIPNAAYPTAGLGLVLGPNGLMDPSAIATGTRTGAKFLRDDQTWQPAGSTTYRKTTAKAVNTTVAATDLLNAEITVAAGVLGTTGLLRLTAWGDYLNNSGGTSPVCRFQLVFGGTTIFDTNTTGAGIGFGASAVRGAWRIVAELLNTSASAQIGAFQLKLMGPTFSGANVTFTTGEGAYQIATQQGDALGFNTGAVNTAVSAALVLNVINGSASGSYETKLSGALVEVV